MLICLFGGLLGLGALAGSVPAVAVVAKIGGHGYGITPITGTGDASLVAAYRAQHRAARPRARAHNFDEPPFGGSPLENAEGGPVMHSATTHVIYWDPPTSQFTATTKEIVGNFFTDVQADSGRPTNVFPIAGQYTDATGHAAYSSTYAGALVDSHAYPTSGECAAPTGVDEGPYAHCLFDAKLQTELSTFIAEKGLPTGPTQLYFVLLPHNIATCLPEVFEGKQVCSNDFYCAYHSFINPGTASEIIYADIPFSLLDTSFAKGCQGDGNAEMQLPNGDRGSSNTETRFADIALKYISHEYIEAVTDPLVNNKTAWVDEFGREIGDKCNLVPTEPAEEGELEFDKHAFTPTLGGSAASGTLFNQSIGGGHFYLQSEWDNAGSACLMQPLAISSPSFTPSPAAQFAGSPIAFTASSADPYGAPGYSWSFGDGTTGSGASTSHVFAAPGVYTVTMTPTDGLTGSTAAAVSQPITISAIPASPPPPPSPVAKVAVLPNSSFPAAKVAVNAKTGAVTLTTSVVNPGTFTWVATFQNGKFGAFASSSKCKTGFVKLGGKCRPAKIVFARGSRTVGAAGGITVTLKPDASALKALKYALKQKKGLPVSLVLSFQSSLGGSPFSHPQSLVDKLKK